MTALHDPTALTGIWQQHRPFVLQLGHALWQDMPDGSPPVTIHGRDLRPESEGVGFQLQLALRDDIYDGQVRAAYYVVQVQLTRGRVSLGWLIDAMPVFEIADDDYELFPKRSHTLPLRQRIDLELLFASTLRDDAQAFFAAARSGQRLPEPSMSITAGSGVTEMPGNA